MIGIRKVRTGITVITLSLILLVTTSNSMSNGLKPAQAAINVWSRLEIGDAVVMQRIQ